MKEIRVQSIGKIILTGKTEILGLTEYIQLCYSSIDGKEARQQPQHNILSLL